MDFSSDEIVSNSITETTRRNIFDSIKIKNIRWNGELEETEFLPRIFDSLKLPSNDGLLAGMIGSISHYRDFYGDWDYYQTFSDDRLNLLSCDDDRFLKFLCVIVHPVVNPNKTEVGEIVRLFNEQLRPDGYKLVRKAQIFGDQVYYVGGKIIQGSELRERDKQIIVNNLSDEYVINLINDIEKSIETSPEIAIGRSKDLIETICKSILDKRGIPREKNWDLPKLMKETAADLKLTPDGVSNEKEGPKIVRKILGALSTIVGEIAELRNKYGAGHGKDSKFKGLNSRHANLAAGAATTLAVFLLETHKFREKK